MRLYVFIFFIFYSVASHATLNFFNVQQKAQLSGLAYGSVDDMTVPLANMGYALITQRQLSETQVSYFLVKKSSEQVLVVRGTANLENVLVDLDIQLRLDEKLNIQLHQGFALAAQSIYEDVKSMLDPALPIVTTGHSLGGAVAVILAMHLDKNNFQFKQSITFGQPKVTNVAGAGDFSHLPITLSLIHI